MIYKNEKFDLTDEFIDIGYMAEEIEACSFDNKDILIKKTSPNRMIQIFLSFPNFEDFKEEISAFDIFISNAKIDIFTYLLFDEKINISYKFKKIIPLVDRNEDFGSMYGTKIINGKFKNKLTKALFIIGKDGAIYHIDMPEDLTEQFDYERLRLELNKVYQSYTGTGCHS